MPRSPSVETRAAARAATVVAAALALGGCYKPSITDNGFLCAPTGKRCPDGFVCGADNHCSVPPTAAVTPPPDSGMETMMTMPPVDGGDDADAMCAAPTPLCAQGPAGHDVCSPACQNGCACGRCNVVEGAAACVAAGTVPLGDVCNPNADNCAPGLICLLEACGNGLARCYRHCTEDAQCAGSACTIGIENNDGGSTSYMTCDVPPRACDPVGNTGCPDPAFNCYLTSANGTLCDCPGKALPGQDNATCMLYNDCAPGFVCISGVDMQPMPHCHFVCDVAKPSCPTSEPNCMPLPGAGGNYGYCSM